MPTLPTFREIEADDFRQRPDEIDDYIALLFEAYAAHGDTGALLASLRTISQVRGVTATAEAAGLSRKGLQKALSENGNPRFESVAAILRALGYCLVPQRAANHSAPQ
jgi:probable addiction module antidote protein